MTSLMLLYSYDVYLSGVNNSIGRIQNLIQGGVYRVVIRKSYQNGDASYRVSEYINSCQQCILNKIRLIDCHEC